MQPEQIKNQLIREITGQSPSNAFGMLMGFMLSGGICILLGNLAVFAALQNQEPSPANILAVSAFSLLVGVALGGLGAYMGWNDSLINEDALRRLTYDESDSLSPLSFLEPNRRQQQEADMAQFGCLLASFQFLFSTLWSSLTFFFKGNPYPEEALRGAVAILMYLKQSGRTSQSELSSGLRASGLPDKETSRALSFLASVGMIVGAAEGFMLTEKAHSIMT